ncbi:MAG: hypothetical protein L6407_08365 [Candidatus Delongbacteria bacterium]|nr:hypothetical protein [Candidatus Delongbacteria bacterium]
MIIQQLSKDQNWAKITPVLGLAFIVFGVLSLINIGFGLFIIVFSVINCFTHIFKVYDVKNGILDWS